MAPLPRFWRAAAIALLAPALAVAADEPLAAAAKKEITASEARTVGALLAGPRFLGRGTGQKGNEDAARWLAKELRDAGFLPGPVRDRVEGGKTVEGDFLQPFDVPAARLPPGATPRSMNVVGYLPGTGRAVAAGTPTGEAPAPAPAVSAPAPAPEVVVLGAHFDHNGLPRGTGKPGKAPKKSEVMWGADDNASGTTAVLLVARALGRLAREGCPPRRTVVVCFFSGEEKGLLGSKHYVAQPVFPVADTVAMINLDMVGRNATKYLEVYGNTSSPELDAWNREVLEETGLEAVYPSPALLQRSDQWSFLEANVPVLFLHGGLHKDYHTNRDTPDLLNYPKIALIARHGLGVLWRAANAEKRPGFRKVDMAGAGGKLGIAVDPCSPEEIEDLGLAENASAVKVTTVFAGSMAEKLFEPGDIVTHWGGFPLLDDDPVGRFTAFVNLARAGDPVVIRFVRGKEKRAVSVKF